MSSVVYVTPSGDAVPCKVTKELIIPQIKGGYTLLKSLGFLTTHQTKRRKK